MKIYANAKKGERKLAAIQRLRTSSCWAPRNMYEIRLYRFSIALWIRKCYRSVSAYTISEWRNREKGAKNSISFSMRRRKFVAVRLVLAKQICTDFTWGFLEKDWNSNTLFTTRQTCFSPAADPIEAFLRSICWYCGRIHPTDLNCRENSVPRREKLRGHCALVCLRHPFTVWWNECTRICVWSYDCPVCQRRLTSLPVPSVTDWRLSFVATISLAPGEFNRCRWPTIKSVQKICAVNGIVRAWKKQWAMMKIHCSSCSFTENVCDYVRPPGRGLLSAQINFHVCFIAWQFTNWLFIHSLGAHILIYVYIGCVVQ